MKFHINKIISTGNEGVAKQNSVNYFFKKQHLS